ALSVAQGSGIGPVSPKRADHPSDSTNAQLRSEVATLQRRVGRSQKLVSEVVTHRVPAQRAADENLVNRASPTVGDFVVSLDGATVKTAGGLVHLSTARVVGSGTNARRVPNQVVGFSKLDLAGQLQHTLGTPWVAYFLFVVGGALLVFEFFTVSIGIAGVVGAIAIVAACYGFSHLPVQGYAVGLLILAMI